ncbi:MAG: hypothetical protein ABFD10_17995 [Prolixibacteraceae bacterium]
MGKTACKKDDYQEPKNPVFYCKKCGLKAEKEKKLCKPKEVKEHRA